MPHPVSRRRTSIILITALTAVLALLAGCSAQPVDTEPAGTE